MNADDKAQEILGEFNFVSSQRGNWESHWQEIAERILPSQSKNFTQLNNATITQGEKRTEFMYDSTASIGLNRFAAILDSLLTPMNATWHKLKVSIPELQKDRNVQLYFEEVNRLLFKYRYAPIANFASQNYQNFKALGAFGTAGMFIDELGSAPGIRYKSVHLSEMFFVENHQGMVDKVLRKFCLTARQAYQKFGDAIPESIKNEMGRNPNKEFFFVHSVYPNKAVDMDRRDYKGMPFQSCFVSVDGSKLISEGGYTTFPYAIARYDQAPGETYGRSPAMEALPAIKTLNEQKKTMLKQGHRAVDPVLLMADDGILDGFSMKPGALNAGGISSDGRMLVQPLPTGNFMIGKDMMDDERSSINDAFLVTLFQILAENPQMTATEVMERSKEKAILLAPNLARQQSEYLGPMIERELDVLAKQGLLPPLPDILIEAQDQYRVEYESPISRTQESEKVAALYRTTEAALQVINITQNPALMDHFNWDVIMPQVANIHGVPSEWLRSLEEIAQIRESRAQEQEQAAQVQAAPGQAAMLNAASKLRA